jgi:uncharacterized membrane protein
MFPGSDFGYMGWMMLGMALFWIAPFALVVWAIVRFSSRDRGSDAQAILKERLARGDISPEEYQSRRSLIGT